MVRWNVNLPLRHVISQIGNYNPFFNWSLGMSITQRLRPFERRHVPVWQSNMAAPIDGASDVVASETSMPSLKTLSAVSPLTLRIIAECPVTKARACDLKLPHSVVHTPVFMPVGTQGTLKGITADQLEDLGCKICLGNTYHLGMRPVGKSITHWPWDVFITSQEPCELKTIIWMMSAQA